MKDFIKKNSLSILNVFILLAISTIFIIFFFSQKKIGYIDTTFLLNNTEISLNARSNFQTKINEFQAEIEKQKQEITILRDLLDKSQDKQTIENELTTKLNSYETYVKEVNNNLQKIEAEIMQPVYEKINKTMTEYGEKNGYYLIFGATSGGNIIYGNKGANLTEEVVEYINSKKKLSDEPTTNDGAFQKKSNQVF